MQVCLHIYNQPFVCIFFPSNYIFLLTFSVYLLEDGLELWLVSLQNSRQLLPQWLQLSANIPPILELGSENLRTMIYIVQAYVILAPTEFITACGGTMVRPLNEQYSDLQDEGVLIILRLVDLVLKVGPPQTSVMFKDLIIRSLKVLSYKSVQYGFGLFQSAIVMNCDFILCIKFSPIIAMKENNIPDTRIRSSLKWPKSYWIP